MELATPHYLHEFMTDHAHRVGTVLEAIVDAEPGGVLIHCFSGRDRAGLTVAMLLDLLGVDHELIAADYWISFDRPQSVEAELGKPTSPVESPPRRSNYTEIMTDVLRKHAATTCFTDPSAAEAARIALSERLCATTPNRASVD